MPSNARNCGAALDRTGGHALRWSRYTCKNLDSPSLSATPKPPSVRTLLSVLYTSTYTVVTLAQ